ncbi:hypothetical protein U9M48_030555 [Paspalum notatum var. saurae]|uniref:Uncharacterized protein n=1 Tax=Paspalum notatum var. saurae TaxID=547442 RepID=A0AAQ3X291_PASNO
MDWRQVSASVGHGSSSHVSVLHALAACHGVWLGRLLADVQGAKSSPPTLKMDNYKHIDTKFHYILECVDNGAVRLAYTGTQEQLVDILMKALGKDRFRKLRELIGVTKLK